ncbi:Uracil DNA glycosylase superfamily [Pannonibacter phragmitetus]|uniref:Uracil DNA glycosylase superfamily n=1 Tax=Pannonibacter phragmitetus TaxID=121719 RepID=A0A378ZU96_9HYPH|nr:Uracil DNA glycosylase superfamily [Pannonibacter phragmitetus]
MVKKGKTAADSDPEKAVGVVASPGLAPLARRVSLCRVCLETPRGRPLPHEPRPVARLSETARLCIAGQAPGTRVHASGAPFTDPSGDRLRNWLGIGDDVFYDVSRVAIVPMGLCFPGLDAKGGDLPPRPECRATWHDSLFAAMPQLKLVLVIGRYAQAYHLPHLKGAGLTEIVGNWRSILADSEGQAGPAYLPLPHPSWRNNTWLRRNPWFEEELVPELRRRVAQLLQS